MPGRNIYKDYVPESYYHIYNRGIDGQEIFIDKDDYVVFLSLLKRYLGNGVSKNTVGVTYPSYANVVEVLAFCLMPNHFHLLIYQSDTDGMKLLLKSLGVAYGMYFNRKYKRLGPVFQQRYRASRISDEAYLLHISRYIHLNPANYRTWQWSSLPYYLGSLEADWIKPSRIVELFDKGEYQKFVADYKGSRDDLKKIKHELANSI